MAPRKKPARTKSVVDENYTPLEQYCIGLNEYYKALKKAGFHDSICMSMIMDKDSYPDWIIPDLPNKIDPLKYIDDEEDD